MGSAKRVSYFFSGLLMMLCSLVIFLWPDAGYQILVLILELTLLIRGIRKLIYYFFMARHMVGGISIFYHSLLLLDAGLFTLYLSDMPRIYVMLYLVVCMLISGAIDTARANEVRRQKSGHWKYQMFSGFVKVLISFICIFHLNSVDIISTIYGLGLLHAAVFRIAAVFRRTAIVYVQ